MADLAQLLQPLTDVRDGRRTPLVLGLDLTGGATDDPAPPVAQPLGRRRPRLADVIEGVRRGAHDPQVAALIAKVDGRSPGFAKVQEVRDAVRAFRAAGKPTVAWGESIGEFGPSTVGYYLAAAFEEIVLGPTGTLGLTGISMRAYFLREAADRLGIETDASARHEYKTAMNMLTERDFTDAHREASEHLVASLSEQVRAGIAEARGLSTERVAELTARGPLLAAEALEAGLVDRLAYRDEVYAELLGRFGEPRLRYVPR